LGEVVALVKVLMADSRAYEGAIPPSYRLAAEGVAALEALRYS